jgi:putative membrane protein
MPGGNLFMKHSNRARVALAVAALAVVAACSKKEAGTGDTGLAVTADTGAMGMSDTAMAVTPAPALTDPNIVYILDNENKLDSAAGAIAATKGTSSEIRDFAKRMMRDHHQIRQQGQDLAKKLGVTPTAPANDGSQAEYGRTLSLLNGAAKGRDFDKAYIDNEVTYHKALLETATAAMNAAQNAELKNFIQKAAPTVQAHLDMAQSVQGKLQ